MALKIYDIQLLGSINSADLCCCLLCKGPKSKDMLLIVIKNDSNEWMSKFFFESVPILIRRVGEKIKSKMYLIKMSLFMVGRVLLPFFEVVLNAIYPPNKFTMKNVKRGHIFFNLRKLHNMYFDQTAPRCMSILRIRPFIIILHI